MWFLLTVSLPFRTRLGVRHLIETSPFYRSALDVPMES